MGIQPHPWRPPLQKQLDRQLGLASIFSIAVGAMLGSGIFVLPGMAAGIAGPGVALSYLLAGLLVFPALLSKAEMATAIPVSGGTYVYVDRSMGPWLGTITGLGTWFSLSAKTAFALAGLGAYLAIFSAMDPVTFALGVLALMLALNVLGTGKVGGLQLTVVGICLTALVAFVAGGAPQVQGALLTPAFPSGTPGILEGAAFVFVSYAGVTKVCSVAEEVRNPARNIPRGMIAAQLTVMVLYAAVASVIVGSVDYSTMSDDVTPLATAAGALFGSHGSIIFAIVAVVGLVSMCNAGVLSTSRYPFAMGRDQLLPSALEHINPRFGTPIRAILLTGVLLVLLLTGLPVVKLAKLASGFKIFLFCINNLALIVLRETATEWYKPEFRAPFYPFLQIAGIVGGIWLLVQLGGIAVVGVGGACVLGSIWYFIYSRRKVSRQGVLRNLWGEGLLEQTIASEASDEAELQPPRVIVPLLRVEEHTELLMRLSAAFVEDGGVLEVVRLEEVPDQTMLSYFEEIDDSMRLLERESEEVAEELHVEVDFRDVITHNARQAVAKHARAVEADWIVMAWPGRPAFRTLLRSPFAWWIDHPPCDLAVYRHVSDPAKRGHSTLDRFKRIIVLAMPGPYDTLLVHVADRIAQLCSGQLTLFLPVPIEEPDTAIHAHEEYHRQFIRLCDAPTEGLVLRTGDAEAAVEELSAEYDLLVHGAPPEEPLRNLLLGSPEHDLVERARCSVLRLKTPRHKVHTRFRPPVRSPRLDHDMEPYLRHAALVPRLQASGKKELFSQLAAHLSAVEDTDLAPTIEAALWEREQSQITALGDGVAMSGAVVTGLRAPVLGLFTLAEPVDFDFPRKAMVDVMVVVLACPADRQTQLWLKDLYARQLREGWLAEHLRQARNIATMLQTVRDALTRRPQLELPQASWLPLDQSEPLTEELPRDAAQRAASMPQADSDDSPTE